jgi:hypothetical protein
MIRWVVLSIFLGILSAFTTGMQVIAQTTAPQQTQPPTAKAASVTAKTLDSSLVSFFRGQWKCAGEFSNGRKIEAELSFSPELDGKWLEYRHADVPPNSFKALAMWGIDQSTGKIVSLMQDNFGGARLFTSGGWVDKTIQFVSAPLMSPITRQERFTFAAQSDAKFKMTYEVSKDGVTWRVGDFIHRCGGRVDNCGRDVNDKEPG